MSFTLDTDWKLGLIGRNGKGKTTFLNLLLGRYEYIGTIRTSTVFDYFPYQIPGTWETECGEMLLERMKPVFQNLNLELCQGERVFLHGKNGCGKSSLIRAVLRNAALAAVDRDDMDEPANGETECIRSGCFAESGMLKTASGLKISYVNQDTSFLRGSIQDFCARRGLDESLFCAICRQLDMERAQFSKNMEDFSEGQKKKVLLAASLLTPAHLYIWDEPLNYIDVFSRMQIEKLILSYMPTMLVVEHDVRFRENIATKVVKMGDADDGQKD